MPFVKIDDRLPEHPKVVAATDKDPVAGWVHVCAIAYANRNRTDGFIPKATAPRLTTAKRPKLAIEALVEAGLWHEVEGGYVIHDYLKHQASAAQISSKLQRDSARKRNGSHAEA